MSTNIYSLIVVGGGHAGAEAALAAARMKVPTLLITSQKSAIGKMPCNPAVGGLAKSHLVYEIDALGGEMGRNADRTALQAKPSISVEDRPSRPRELNAPKKNTPLVFKKSFSTNPTSPFSKTTSLD